MSEPHMRFGVRGEGQATLEIDVYDVIGDTWDGRGMSAKKMRGILRNNSQAKTIRMHVNSGGGDVIDGFAIYQLLAEHPARVEADVDGLAASMASVIIMAADEIRIAPHAMVMIHNPWTIGMGEADDFRKVADLLDKVRENIVSAYVERTGIARDEAIALMDAETWMNAEEALDRGFVDQIKETKKPAAKALASLDLSAFARVPEGFRAAVAKARADRAASTLSDSVGVGVVTRERAPRARTGTIPVAEYEMQIDMTPLADRVNEAVERIDAQIKSSTAAFGGASNKENKMDLKELKAQHPEAFEAAVQEGVKQERDRVSAHLTMGEACGDLSIATKAIKEGSEMTASLNAEYMAVAMKSRAISARQADSDEAGRAADRAVSGPADENDLDAKAKQMADMVKAQLGQKVG